jgi:hypothetical protein
MSRLLKIASEFNVAVVITNQARATTFDHCSQSASRFAALHRYADARMRVLHRR